MFSCDTQWSLWMGQMQVLVLVQVQDDHTIFWGCRGTCVDRPWPGCRTSPTGPGDTERLHVAIYAVVRCSFLDEARWQRQLQRCGSQNENPVRSQLKMSGHSRYLDLQNHCHTHQDCHANLWSELWREAGSCLAGWWLSCGCTASCPADSERFVYGSRCV